MYKHTKQSCPCGGYTGLPKKYKTIMCFSRIYLLGELSIAFKKNIGNLLNFTYIHLISDTCIPTI